jgi:hypothetical protein
MASGLPSNTNVGQVNVCLFRIARLDSDCSIAGGTNGGYVTVGLASINHTPQTEETAEVAPKNGCGDVMYRVPARTVTTGRNLTGELWFFDWEAMELLFGGEVLVGKGGGPFAGDTNGYASPNYTDPPSSGVYLETISQQVAQGAGDCITVGGEFAPYVGDIFGKCVLNLGDITREEGAARLTFSGTATGNPALYDGPWNDSPIAGYLRNSPWQQVGYSAAEYATILATAAAGYQDLAPGS